MAAEQHDESPLESIGKQLTDRSKPFTLAVDMIAHPGKGDLLEAAYVEHVKNSRTDLGMLRFDLSRDSQNRDIFFLYERWANFDSLVQHFDKPWTKKIFVVMDELLARPVQVKVLLVAAE
jgi:quinol monooxygenase YgiN